MEGSLVAASANDNFWFKEEGITRHHNHCQGLALFRFETAKDKKHCSFIGSFHLPIPGQHDLHPSI